MRISSSFGFSCLHAFPAQSEVLENARSEVLDDRVAFRDELFDQLEALRLGEVEGDGELVAVRVQEVRARLPPLFVVCGHHAPDHAQAVWAPTDSTWMTSAPKVASMCEAAGPAHQAVRSRMRRPASGSDPLESVPRLARRLRGALRQIRSARWLAVKRQPTSYALPGAERDPQPEDRRRRFDRAAWAGRSGRSRRGRRPHAPSAARAPARFRRCRSGPPESAATTRARRSPRSSCFQPGAHDFVPLVESHQAAGELRELLVLTVDRGARSSAGNPRIAASSSCRSRHNRRPSVRWTASPPTGPGRRAPGPRGFRSSAGSSTPRNS